MMIMMFIIEFILEFIVEMIIKGFYKFLKKGFIYLKSIFFSFHNIQ